MKKIYKSFLVACAVVAGLFAASNVGAANLATNLTWCVTNSGSISISYEECVGLAHLYHETSGDRWTNTGNWFSSTTLTSWVKPSDITTGALSIAGGHLIALDLNSSNLSGSITTGLIYLPYLNYLFLSSNSINFMNLSQNTGLIQLETYGNVMSGINLTMLTGLKVLSVGSTSMNTVNLSQQVNLRRVLVYGVNNSWVDFSANTLLTGVSVANMPITGLDFRANTQLLYIDASYNSGHLIQTINVSGLTLLKTLYATHGGLRYIDLSTNTGLESFGCDICYMTGISLSGLVNLHSVGLYANSISQIDLSRTPRLRNLYMGYQSGVTLTTIDISQNTGMLSFDFEGNPISSLTVSSNSLYPSTGVINLSGNALNPNVLDLNTLWFLHDHYSAWGYRGIGGGVKIVIKTDVCPNGDTSPTQYDGLCSGMSAVTTGTTTTTGAVSTTGTQNNSSGSTETPVLTTDTDVYNRAYAHGITTMSLAKARLHDTIQRYEAAKMIVNFVKNVEGKTIMPNANCKIENFSDYNAFDAEMRTYIKAICDLGLMGWKPGKTAMIPIFRPFDTLSAQEFGIVIGRYLGESATHPDSSRRVDIMRFLGSVTTQ